MRKQANTKHLYNIWTMLAQGVVGQHGPQRRRRCRPTLYKCYTNVIQMFCVNWAIQLHKDNQLYLFICKVTSYCCFPLHSSIVTRFSQTCFFSLATFFFKPYRPTRFFSNIITDSILLGPNFHKLITINFWKTQNNLTDHNSPQVI